MTLMTVFPAHGFRCIRSYDQHSKIIFHLVHMFWKAKNKIADGSFSFIAGHGIDKINPTLSLKSVSHVPNLSYNLSSIGKITKDFNCLVIFTSSSCTFQDSVTGRAIAHAKEKDGLYYIDTNWKIGVLRCQGLVLTSYSKVDQIWL